MPVTSPRSVAAPQHSPVPSAAGVWFVVVWLALLITTGWFEALRFVAAAATPAGPMLAFTEWDPESTLPFVCLAVLPLLLTVRRRSRSRHPTPDSRRRAASTVLSATTPPTTEENSSAAQKTEREPQPASRVVVAVCSVMIFLTSLLCSWRIGATEVALLAVPGIQHRTLPFAKLPPEFHDEYSYLLQARIFLSGQLSCPPMTFRPDLFHQVHVLNERRTVSRYFPLTAAWMAPFKAFGRPVFGHRIAGALAAVFFFLSFRRIVSTTRYLNRTRFPTALLGGMLIAASPGIAAFSNLLLAHHPTMLALSIFTWAFLKTKDSAVFRNSLTAGCFLTLAMLGRPMTAAGYALPWGIWLLRWMIVHRNLKPVAGYAVPLVAGFVLLGILNHDATGSWTRSTYQEYTDRYTPRHKYGFNNALPSEKTALADETDVMNSYDRWAENLTPQTAVRNVGHRVLGSLQWSLSIFPILFGTLMTVPPLVSSFRNSGDLPGKHAPETTVPDRNPAPRCIAVPGLWLCLSSIVCLHVVHIPYWFDGILHWHYVFETAPLLLLLTAAGLGYAWRILTTRLPEKTAALWVCVLPLVGLLPGWVSCEPFGGRSKVDAFISERAWARTRLHYFNE
ncbi:MAG: hypothetical protein KDA89_16840, partial [Planctomycetaceae bacterium]|nr:hypothetical protein [Planctomycetaceae bacterium]